MTRRFYERIRDFHKSPGNHVEKLEEKIATWEILAQSYEGRPKGKDVQKTCDDLIAEARAEIAVLKSRAP